MSGSGETTTDLLAGLSGHHPIALLPARLETRFVTDDAGPALLVRIYPDEIHIDDHHPGLTDGEAAAAERYWHSLWRAGRDAIDAERAAFVQLADRVGVHRALWAVRATQPDEAQRPTDPVPDGAPLPSVPVLADASRADPLAPTRAVAAMLPERWVVIGYRGGTEVLRAVGAPVPDPLPIGPSSKAPPAGQDAAHVALDDELRWLVEFGAAVTIGMGIRVELDEVAPLDRLIAVGVRATEDASASAARLRELLDAQRYTSGVGFLRAGTPTNNTPENRSAWSRRPDAAEAFAADRAGAPAPSADAPAAAGALGLPADTLVGVPDASGGDARLAAALHRALWPSSVGYFLEHLLHPVVGDETIDAIRRLFVASVRGLGPLPTLRIGAQPYGLLPVTSLRRWESRAGDEGIAAVVELLRTLAPEWLAATSGGASRAVPHVGRSGADADQELLDILARDAISGTYRLRPVRGSLTTRAMGSFTGEVDVAGPALASAAHRLLGGRATLPRLAGFEFESRAARLRRPVVIGGPLSETDPLPSDPTTGLNYLAFLAERRERTEVFRGRGSTSLLFALSRHACDLADADAAVRITGPASVAAAKAALEPDVVDLDPARPSATMPRLLARAATDVIAPQLPADMSVGDFVATATNGDLEQLGRPHVTAAVGRARDVRRAIGSLATVPTAELDRMTRAALDVCSHRLDAWITAVATTQLTACREMQPEGVHVGGFGWVERVRPKPPPESVTDLPHDEVGPLVRDTTNDGYVVAPSLTQATTAALLLSGHLSRRGSAASTAFAIDLSSDRVRVATGLLDGVRQGQSLGALLGYRFERALHERSTPGVELDRFIRPLRAVAPLVAGLVDDLDSTVEAVEAAAASNVVDGLALLTRFEEDPAALAPALAGATDEEHAAVLAVLATLADAADALADLVSAEIVHQLAAGQVARGAATLDALGSGLAAPPEPEVVATPRAGFAYTHRVVVVAPMHTAPPQGWSTGADRPRRLAEPRLDAWVAAILGPAANIRGVVRIAAADDAVRLAEVTVADVGACALDLLYGRAGSPTPFERELVDHVRRAGAPTGAQLSLVHEEDPDWPAASWPAGAISLDDALEQARWLWDSVGSARPLTASDLATGVRGRWAGVRRDELADRVATAADRLRASVHEFRVARDEFEAEPSPQRAARVAAAAPAVAAFGVAAAGDVVDTVARDDSGGAAVLAAADAVLAETARTLKILDETPPAVDADGQLLPEVVLLQAMFGSSFVVLPLVDVPAGWTAARDACATADFVGGDLAAPVAWLHRVARVREPVHRYLWAVAGGGGEMTAVQLPVASRWIALPRRTHDVTPPSATSVIVHRHTPEAAAEVVAGFVVDEWSDVVPAATTTAGVAFHYDEPGARAPHAILLAVPPQIGAPWTLDALAEIVCEAADLSRIRMVGPDEMPWLGRFLPALYVADAASGDTLGVDVRGLVGLSAGDDR